MAGSKERAVIAEPDEFDELNVSFDLTDEDLRALDAASRSTLDPPRCSPFETYRKGKRTLSVSDLVGPAWCEVQFDYGLRQRRHRPIRDRPKVFFTETGKAIQVNELISQANEVRLDGGKSVHAELEREIFPEQIRIPAQSAEEKWGLRLLQMMSCLEALKNLRVSREFPVFGLVGTNRLVVGIIDEIRDMDADQPHPEHASDPQTRLDKFLTTPQAPIKRLQVIDTKTRRTKTMPSYSDTTPARLQLMLYKALLEPLLDVAQPIDFSALWEVLGVDPHKVFSLGFLASAGVLSESNGLVRESRDSICLSDLSAAWRSTILSFNASKFIVDDNLLIIYRMRRHQTRSPSAGPIISRDASEETSPPAGAETGLLQSGESEQLIDSASPDTNHSTARPIVESARSNSKGLVQSQHGIIGSLNFRFESGILQSYLTNILEWWDGHRPPKGVDIEDIGRCRYGTYDNSITALGPSRLFRTCEYESGCEWLEQKAVEHRILKTKQLLPSSSLNVATTSTSMDL